MYLDYLSPTAHPLADRPAQLAALRRTLPRLLGSLSEEAWAAIAPLLRWHSVELASGETLFAEGDASDCLYLVLSGRLRASAEGFGAHPKVLGDVARGESVGEVGVFTGEPRQATVVALRDTVLARIERSDFSRMLQAAPSLSAGFAQLVANRLRRLRAFQPTARGLGTLAVETLTPGLDLAAWLPPLLVALQAPPGPEADLLPERPASLRVRALDSAAVNAAAGRPDAAQATPDEPEAYAWLLRYLDEQEAAYDLLLYISDPPGSDAPTRSTNWTARCRRQADELLVLADALAPPVGALAPVGRCTLVLLHPADANWASGTAAWLAACPAAYRHFHWRRNRPADAARLARHLNGRAVGLVLAGGGARSLAQLGVWQALQEAGIPVDAVGGTSVGAVMGAGIAFDWPAEALLKITRAACLSNPLGDFKLLPLLSLIGGRRIDALLESHLGGKTIEDQWIPFFCVSSNLTLAQEHTHHRGDLRRAVRASVAMPGVLPPVAIGGDVHVDGGMFNNLPVEAMTATGVGTVLAVTLRIGPPAARPGLPTKAPDAWDLLRDRLRPQRRRHYQLPSLLEGLAQATMMNFHQKSRPSEAGAHRLFVPDVKKFGVLECSAHDALVAAGHTHAQQMLATWLNPERESLG